MKYTLTTGKVITIPDEEITKQMKILSISKDEAIQLWLDDNDYTTNEVVEELTAKAKQNHITATIHAAGTKTHQKKARTPKEDPEKTDLIQFLAENLQNKAENVIISNKTKIIEFDIGENHYKLDLIRQRKPKN